MLKKLNELNSVEIKSLSDDSFKPFGRILTEFDVSDLITYMENNTAIPESGNSYIPSEEAMECFEISKKIQNTIYGEMDIQVGYCNGKNSTYNGFEYHKGSEITVAVTDFLLVLGHSYDIKDNTYKNEDAKVFFVEKGTVFEIYQTTLHLSPCKVADDGYKAVIILPKGTNTPLKNENKKDTKESEILLLTNKWIICHKDREPLVKAGAHIGIIGENTELKYK